MGGNRPTPAAPAARRRREPSDPSSARPMAVHALARMTWEEVAALPRERCVAILPVGAVEAHGPHLPLGTDVVIAEAMARAGAERLAGAGWEVLVLPAAPYTPAPFAAAFAGTLSVRADALRALVEDVGRGLAAHGVRWLALANAHLDPANVSALHEAAEALQGPGGIGVVFPDVTRRRWAERLTGEFRSGACHAGRYEGSVVLAETPDDVRREVAAGLPPVDASLTDAIRRGDATFEEAGGDRAYFGSPAEATAEEGRETVATLGAILAEAVEAAAEAGAPGASP